MATQDKETTKVDSVQLPHHVGDKNYPQGLIIAFKLKSVSDEIPSKQNSEKCSSISDEIPPEQNSEKCSAAAYKDNMDVVLREDLKSVFEKFGTVKYIDFKMGAESGYIRFEDTEAAQKAHAAAVISEKGGSVVKNYIAILDPLTGEAEREYLGGAGKVRGWIQRCLEFDFTNMLLLFSVLLAGRKRVELKLIISLWRGRKHGRGGKHARSRENESRADRPNKAQKVGDV